MITEDPKAIAALCADYGITDRQGAHIGVVKAVSSQGTMCILPRDYDQAAQADIIHDHQHLKGEHS